MTRFALAALAALTPIAAPANASAIQFKGDQAYVGYQDLNLSSHEGRDALLRRIKVAAYTVCNPEEFNRFSQADPKCVRIAIANGIEQMDAVMSASVRG